MFHIPLWFIHKDGVSLQNEQCPEDILLSLYQGRIYCAGTKLQQAPPSI